MEPYKGLRPYEEQDKDNFFGREAEKQILIGKILTNKLTLLFAASGVGKSSLLQAAVMPQLKDPAGENVDVVYHNQWFANPEADLKQTLIDYLQQHQKITADDIPDVSLPLPLFLHFCTIFTSEPLVIILDQFEEFFNYQRYSKEFKPFVQQLAEAVLTRETPTAFVFSMREDFALELNAFKPELPTLLFNNFYRLEKLSQEKAKQAIIAPLEPFGFSYEPGLLDMLLDDLSRREQRDRFGNAADLLDAPPFVEPPHLQIVCLQLWQLEQHNQNQQITIATYQQQGRATDILKNYFVTRIQQLSSHEQGLASKSFNYLVNKHGTKMAYPLGDLAEQLRVEESALGNTLDKLEQARILRCQKRQNMLWYELYHDIFAKSIYDWNERYKTRQFIIKAVIGTGVVFVSGALLFLGMNWWINHTHHHLRLSSKTGISDTIEVYQGKSGSWDIWGLQKNYIAETRYQRTQVEPDKLFTKKSLGDFDALNLELIGYLPLLDRIQAYLKNGQIDKALILATRSISPGDMQRSQKVIDTLAAFRSTKGIEVLTQVFNTTRDSYLKTKIIAVLGTIDTPQSIKMLLTVLDDQNEKVRDAAIESLDKFDDIRVLRSLIDVRDENSKGQNTLLKKVLENLDNPKATELLIPLLKEKNNEVLNSVVQVLGRLGDSNAVESLIPLLKNEDAKVRKNVVNVLDRLGDSRAIGPLIFLLKDKDAEVRKSVVNVLGRLGDSKAVEPLILLLKDEDAEVRKNVVNALGHLSDSKTIKPLILLLKDEENTGIRKSVVNVLGHLGDSKAVEPLIRLLKKDEYVEVRENVVKNLRHFEDAIVLRSLIAVKKDILMNLTDLRKVFSDLDDPKFVDILIPLLKDENGEVRAGVAQALGYLGDAKVAELLIPLLEDKNSQVRASVTQTLGYLGDTKAVDLLIPLLEDKNSQVRASVAQALGDLGNTKVVDSLIPLLEDKNSQVRESIVQALDRLSDVRVVDSLIPLLKDEKFMVRYYTAQALVNLGSAKALRPLVSVTYQSIKTPHNPFSGRLDVSFLNALIHKIDKLDYSLLIELLKDENTDVRNYAVKALGNLGNTKAVTTLVALLKDKNVKVRNSVAKALGHLGDSRAVEPLILLLKDENAQVRNGTVEALINFNDTKVVKALILHFAPTQN